MPSASGYTIAMRRTATNESDNETAAQPGGWFASVLFWLALLVAAVLYASVVLAPKVLAYLDLRDEYVANQVELVAREREVNYLSSVAGALRSDPDFAAELARIDFDAVRPGEERIAVEEHLSLQPRSLEAAAAVEPPNVPYAEFARELAALADRPKYRTGALLSSVILVVIAFSFFNGFQAEIEPDDDEDDDDDDDDDEDDTEWDDEDDDE